MDNSVEGVESAELSMEEIDSGVYRKVHALASIKLVGYPGKYMATCVCGWESASSRYYLDARGAMTNHVLEEADKLMEGAT